MVNHDCDGRHKICDLLSAMSKVPQCFAGIACGIGICSPWQTFRKQADRIDKPADAESPFCARPACRFIRTRTDNPMPNMKSVLAATLRGPAPAIIPAGR
jgi:hypothetical protein